MLMGPPCDNVDPEGKRPDRCPNGGCGPDPNKWFRKMDYKYCRAECVKAHQRILQAEAAMKRFGGN